MKGNDYMVAEMQLTYRNPQPPDKRICVTDMYTAYKVLKEFYPDDQMESKEYVKVLLLNQSSEVLGCMQVAEGGLNKAYVDLKYVLQAALLSNAAGIILSHNHPSAKAEPSGEDWLLTEHLFRLCQMMNVELIDHIILCPYSYFSFSYNNVMPLKESKRKLRKLGEKNLFKV